MVTPKQLDFSSSGGVDDSDYTPSQRKSLRNTAINYAVPDAEESDEETKRTKKKKKKNKSVSNRIWDEEDELTVLKGLVDYRANAGFPSKIDWSSFYGFIGGSINAKFSKEQVLRKIRKLKRRFLNHSDKINQGRDPHFTRSSDSEVFGFSMMLWGQKEAESGHSGMDDEMLKAHEDPLDDYGVKDNGTDQNGEEMLKEQVYVATVEPLDDNGDEIGTDNGIAQNGAQNGAQNEEILKEQVDVATVEPLNDNGKSHHDSGTENGTAQNGEEILKEQVDVATVESLNDNGKSHHDSGTENGIAQNGEEILKEQMDVATVEPLNDNGKSHHDSGTENGTAQNGEEILKEHVEVTNVEPLNDNGKLQNHNGTENRIAGKESHDNDDDELCAVRDAFETMMSQGLSDYQKKVQLGKLMNLAGSKRRELSEEWKALCVEERRLHVKRLRFSAKLAEAANDS